MHTEKQKIAFVTEKKLQVIKKALKQGKTPKTRSFRGFSDDLFNEEKNTNLSL